MVKKFYNVILQSAIGNGSTVLSETYFYDWTRIPDVPYKLTFTFNSTSIVPSVSTNASIYMNLSQPYNDVASAQGTTAVGYRSDFLGSLYINYNTSSFSYLAANITSNPPVYLDGRPRNNNFMVQILSGVDTAYNVVPVGYQLILSFEEL
jgi:hypothetical protein